MQSSLRNNFDELIALWKEVFKDDDDFLIPFFNARKDDLDVYYIKEDNKIVSVIYYIKTKALIHKKEEEVRLIVGVAIKKEYRKRGLMASLIASSRKHYTCPLLLYPAVRAYYEANGFYSSSKALTFTFKERKLSFQSEYNIKTLNDIYNTSIRSKGGLLRDEYAWHSLLEDHYLIFCNDSYALYNVKERCFSEATALNEAGSKELISSLSGKVTVIPGSFLEEYLIKQGYKGEETLLGMSSTPLDIYIAEQY